MARAARRRTADRPPAGRGLHFDAVFVTGLPWWLPFAHDQEFHYNAVQSVIANAYLLCAVGLIGQARKSEARMRYTWRLRS
ncbi:hypothetical protein JOF29_004577 [Kribbella aluminosa]|uniref:Uncharacterized protein n=1 Tax=Kribbella aluminosa TaxID=416017 RepID=A0ABS4UPA0_9ACTN|nr:hypothetical protein [Kribbella aluminosa]MBP2353467.1 hypothetical protein [Kribbella aluminosa]